MIELIDGKGQLGFALNELMNKDIPKADAKIYHTWNFLDKSEDVQKECYEKFKRFVDENPKSKVIFTSTYSQTDNYYNFYKQLSEAYLLANNEEGYVIRLPTLIGKGICQKFKDEEDIQVFGEMELMTIEDAAKGILRVAESSPLVKNIRFYGDKVPATLAKNLILFGKK